MTEEELLDALNSEGLGSDFPPQDMMDQHKKASKFEIDNLIPSSAILAEKKQLTPPSSAIDRSPSSKATRRVNTANVSPGRSQQERAQKNIGK
jgi:hypothetical protein